MQTNNFLEWTKILGSSEWDRGQSLTTGSDGSIFITGQTNGNLDGESNKGGYGDVFLSKYNSDGTKYWTKLLGSSSSEYGYALTKGTDDSIYIAGNTEGDLDGQTNNGSNDSFIAKY